jgi:hypothetical protein
MAAALAASGETSTALRPRLFQNGNERCSCVAGFCRTGRSIPLRRSQDKNLPWLPLNTSIARMHVIARIAGGSQDKQQQVFLYCKRSGSVTCPQRSARISQ